ncbi:zonular occludens toxin domain-containing protein [Pseudoxanthomonas koreensis]|uniref:zonular occludens toxin domain-containing protein n=1 Tax=Pseudoxanthomonas koreensis TaxID=266061 RepID=UPI0035A5FC5E
MPIEIYSGQPGNGKTALMMERLLQEAEKGERPLFAVGIEGLRDGLATPLEDARSWNAKDPATGEYIVPHGSLIFVDEAWKWFGHLHDASRQATPKHVLDLAEHRHRGLDFVWTTQQPNQLYPFIRGLIGSHHHVVRRFGTKMIDVFSWGELNEDVKSSAKRELAQRKTRLLPAHAFDAYKSAEVHTIKARVPFKVLAIPGLILAAGILGWWAVSVLRPDAYAASLTGKVQTSAAQAAPAAVPAATGQGDRAHRTYATLTDYARAHLPRFASMPWTAPVFDERGITADPQLYCMSSMPTPSEPGEPSCTCLTEQGTRYDISQPECRTVARHGMPYNPYRERREERMQQPQPQHASAGRPAGVMHQIPGSVTDVVGAGPVL